VLSYRCRAQFREHGYIDPFSGSVATLVSVRKGSARKLGVILMWIDGASSRCSSEETATA